MLHVTVATDGMLERATTPPMDHRLSFVPHDDAGAMRAGLAEADALVTRRFRVDDELPDAAPRLRLVQQVGLGSDRIDLGAARRRGVAVANTPEAVLRASDVLVIAAALTPATRGLLGPAELALMKPSAILVNIARGAIVDEDALMAALTAGRLRGAALDAFAHAPLPADCRCAASPMPCSARTRPAPASSRANASGSR